MTKLRVSVVGAAGYAGGEALRLLSSHPEVEITLVVSETYAGKPVSASFPGFSKSSLVFKKLNLVEVTESSDIVIFGQENGYAMQHVAALLDAGKKIIDISADFRLKDSAQYPIWYKLTHKAPELLRSAVYGLAELHREDIRKASLIANPGCYPTASILGLTPLVEAGLVELSSIVIDAKSGVSGAGRGKHSLDFHFPEVNENVRAYGVGGVHRHTPEIEQELSLLASSLIRLTFTPHLIPITRGILATCYATPKKQISVSDLHALYTKRYRSEPFVTVLEPGAFPTTKGTCGTNQCHIGVAVDERTGRVIVVSAIDNLGKGAAGQVVQNLNLMSGFAEDTALSTPGVWP